MVKYTFWQDESMWIGYLEEYPDYWTQGTSLKDLEEHLTDLYQDLSNGTVPHSRKIAHLANV
jgi:predicted RNase H-like HicB family nuclease